MSATTTTTPSKIPPLGRRIYLIDPRFQLSVIFHGLLVVAIVTVMFYFYVSMFLFRVNELASSFETTTVTAGATQPSLVIAIEQLHNTMFPWFVIVILSTGIVIMAFLLFFSHRIAGPIYHAVNYLNAVAKNPKSRRHIVFRDKDYFHELADALNRALPADSDQK